MIARLILSVLNTEDGKLIQVLAFVKLCIITRRCLLLQLRQHSTSNCTLTTSVVPTGPSPRRTSLESPSILPTATWWRPKRCPIMKSSSWSRTSADSWGSGSACRRHCRCSSTWCGMSVVVDMIHMKVHKLCDMCTPCRWKVRKCSDSNNCLDFVLSHIKPRISNLYYCHSKHYHLFCFVADVRYFFLCDLLCLNTATLYWLSNRYAACNAIF